MDNYVCTLSIRRSLAPATSWHWAVEMPDGHVFACSKGGIENLPDVMADATINGVEALKRAETVQARYDPVFAKAIGLKGLVETR